MCGRGEKKIREEERQGEVESEETERNSPLSRHLTSGRDKAKSNAN